MPVETRPEPGTHRLGVREAALPLAVRFARPAAGGLAPAPRRPSVLADRLIRPDRAGPAPDGLGPDVVKAVDPGGELSEQHLEELAHLAPTLHALWDAIEGAANRSDGPHPAARPPAL